VEPGLMAGLSLLQLVARTRPLQMVAEASKPHAFGPRDARESVFVVINTFAFHAGGRTRCCGPTRG
jgi:hypothetical protein